MLNETQGIGDGVAAVPAGTGELQAGVSKEGEDGVPAARLMRPSRLLRAPIGRFAAVRLPLRHKAFPSALSSIRRSILVSLESRLLSRAWRFVEDVIRDKSVFLVVKKGFPNVYQGVTGGTLRSDAILHAGRKTPSARAVHVPHRN